MVEQILTQEDCHEMHDLRNHYGIDSRCHRSGLDTRFWEEDKEYGPACAGCSETLIQVGKDSEFELKEEHRGKIMYQEGDYLDEGSEEHLAIGIIISATGRNEYH